MMTRLGIVVCACVLSFPTAAAPVPDRLSTVGSLTQSQTDLTHRPAFRRAIRHQHRRDNINHSRGRYAAGARPGKWCGWWMRTQFGGGVQFNRARTWATRGRATHARVGAIVVWPHHVGLITGRSADGRWIVTSGNDGGRVRTRPRSVKGAIAFRWVRDANPRV